MAYLRRNDPCWCGSELKYKKCHLRREDQAPENPFVIRQRLFDLQKRKYCFCEFDAGNCSDVFSSSHSISKSGSLRLIAERSHVASIQGDFQFVRGVDSYYESLRIVDLSINKASTFYGFCDFHDGKNFAQLDRLDFSDPSLFFWQMIYRAAAFEKYHKVVAVDFSDQVRLLDKGAGLSDQLQMQFEAKFQKWSHGQGLRNINLLLKTIESVYQNRSFDQVSYSYFVTDRRLPFAGVGCFQPSRTINGEALQRVNVVLPHELFGSTPISDSVCIAAIPMKSSTLLCLCSLRGQTKARAFMESLTEDADGIVNLFFGVMMLSIENMFFTPSYLRTLSQASLSHLKRLSSLGIAEDIKEDDIRLARAVSLFGDVSIVDRASS